jgi:hypothetical protein
MSLEIFITLDLWEIGNMNTRGGFMVNTDLMDVDWVVTYYNGHDFIESAIISAVDETVPFRNIIIVDDGSKPESYEFVKNIC